MEKNINKWRALNNAHPFPKILILPDATYVF